MPRLTSEEERIEVQEVARDTLAALKTSHRSEAWALLVFAIGAAAAAVLTWSAAWGAAALVILSVQTVLVAIQRGQAALSFSMAVRENEYRRIMDDLAVLTEQGGNFGGELRSLRGSLTDAGVIADQQAEIRRLKALTTRIRGIEPGEGT